MGGRLGETAGFDAYSRAYMDDMTLVTKKDSLLLDDGEIPTIREKLIKTLGRLYCVDLRDDEHVGQFRKLKIGNQSTQGN